MMKNFRIFLGIITALLAFVGFSIYAIDKKIDSLLRILDHESAKKENDISKIFLSFARGEGLNNLARTYQTGCQKPVNFSLLKISKDRDGFQMKCEVYIDEKSVVEDNISFEKTIDVDIFLGGVRGSVDSIRLSANFPNNIQVPYSISKYASTVGCEDGSASGGKNYYKVSLPSTNPFFVSYEWSCGSGGCWNSVEMNRASQVSKTESGDKLLNPGERSTLSPDSGWKCG